MFLALITYLPYVRRFLGEEESELFSVTFSLSPSPPRQGHSLRLSTCVVGSLVLVLGIARHNFTVLLIAFVTHRDRVFLHSFQQCQQGEKK